MLQCKSIHTQTHTHVCPGVPLPAHISPISSLTAGVERGSNVANNDAQASMGLFMFYKASVSKCMWALKAARKLNKACEAMQDSLPWKWLAPLTLPECTQLLGPCSHWHEVNEMLPQFCLLSFYESACGKELKLILQLICVAMFYSSEIMTQVAVT